MKAPERIILCVDDDPDDQYLVQETIRQLEPGARIVTAANGQEALNYLQSLQLEEALPSLIIMDINMPLMDGKEAVVRLKQEARLTTIPLVMFTTSSGLLDKRFCEQYGVPFLTKPIRQSELYALVNKMLDFAQ